MINLANLYDTAAQFAARLYLSHHYNKKRAEFEAKLTRTRGVAEIDLDTATKRLIEEHQAPPTDAEREEQWYLTAGSVATIETLNDYARSWRMARQRAAKRGKGEWFWNSKRRPMKLQYRPFYQDPVREQYRPPSDMIVYRHAKANGVDVSQYFVTKGFEGGKSDTDTFEVVCTADAWKVEYCEQHKLDPNEDYADAA